MHKQVWLLMTEGICGFPGHPAHHRPPQSRGASCCPITPLPSRRCAPLWIMVAGTSRGLQPWLSLRPNCRGKNEPHGLHEMWAQLVGVCIKSNRINLFWKLWPQMTQGNSERTVLEGKCLKDAVLLLWFQTQIFVSWKSHLFKSWKKLGVWNGQSKRFKWFLPFCHKLHKAFGCTLQIL